MDRHRSLATVLFTDLVGSTRRAAELGDQRWRELLQDYYTLVRTELERFEGREIAVSGDGFLTTFGDPEHGIRCACAIRDGVRALGMETRSGLHMGEVEAVGSNVAGMAVHIGARVCGLAVAGEVLVSGTVKDLVVGSGIDFESRGAHTLRGVPGQWQLFAVTSEPTGIAPPRSWTERLRLPRIGRKRRVLAAGAALAAALAVTALYLLTREGDGAAKLAPTVAMAESADPAIAVLPFSVQGSRLEVFEKGMPDLLSTDLDGVAGLRAIDSRTVLARWRERVRDGEPADLATMLEVAAVTGARFALVGFAVDLGRQIRLSADVYDLRSRTKLGSGEATGSPDSLVALVDRLSIAVLDQVAQGRATDHSHVGLSRVMTDSVEALKAYLEGNTFFAQADFKNALAAYERAVEADSTFALALYRLATVRAARDGYAPVTEEYLEQAARLASRLTERGRLLVRVALALHRGTLDAIALAEEAVTKYPDDVEAWFWLGEAYFRLGPQGLAGPETSEGAYSTAIQLDPSFTPPYNHLIELAFTYHADSTLAAHLIEAFARISGDEEAEELNRIAFALAFGDAMSRGRALGAVDTLLSEPRWHLATRFLWTPRYREVEEQVLSRGRWSDDPNHEMRDIMTKARAYRELSHGRFRAALSFLEDARSALPFPGVGLYVAYTMGMPVPQSRLDRALALSEGARSPDLEIFYSGAYASDRERWADHAYVLDRLRDHGRRFLAEGDSTGASVAEGMAVALEGYALWRQGDREEAARRLALAQRQATGLKWGRAGINAVIRFWLGRLLLEMERAQEAESYFKTRAVNRETAWVWQDPLFDFYLGKIYEDMQRFGDARRAYESFVTGWGEADPELQPMVQEARAAVARLESVIRE